MKFIVALISSNQLLVFFFPVVFDPCTGYVCHNGGSCLSNNGEPICKCMSPFEGPTCDGMYTKANDCTIYSF